MSLYDDQYAADSGEPDPHMPQAAEPMTPIALDRLDELGVALAARRDEWMAARQASGVEKRWMQDLEQYMGRDDASRPGAGLMDTVLEGYAATSPGSKPQRSTVFVNITRPKTNTAQARVANMLLPTDDRNYGLKPSPQPRLTELARLQARSAADGDAQAELERAAACAQAMQDEIDDQLQACNFNAECRKMIHDAAVLGTGVIKGPVVVNRKRKTWVSVGEAPHTAHVLELELEQQPASQCVSPWDVLTDPSCGSDPHAGMGIFERVAYTSKQLRELVHQPGYLRANIGKVLAQGPRHPDHPSERDRQHASAAPAWPFECWEYWGEFKPEDLRAAGVDVPEDSTELVSGCVVFVNDVVIKGFLNPHETGDLPYDFFVWEPDASGVWGYGVPYLCRAAQRVLNAAWRQLMDNSGLSMGPQVVVNRQAVQPMDGRWEITGRKIWELVDNAVDARAVFNSVEFSNHGQEIQQIVELALKFADMETAVPQLAQGEHANVPDTLGGMVILQNSTNVVLGRLTKAFDDHVTAPHIARYVEWNMAYNPKPEIKGDHHVVARGTSALLVRDLQHQALLQLGQYQGSGIISPMVRWQEWFKECLRAQHIDPALIMKSEAEISAQSNQPPQATPEQIRAQALLQVAQLRAQAALQTAQVKAQGELAYAQSEAQMAQQNAAAKAQEVAQNNSLALQELQMQRDLALLNYAHKYNLTLAQIKGQLAQTQMQEQTKRDLAAAEIQMRQDEGNANREHEALLNPMVQPGA